MKPALASPGQAMKVHRLTVAGTKTRADKTVCRGPGVKGGKLETRV
jgi:hypothetical protein